MANPATGDRVGVDLSAAVTAAQAELERAIQLAGLRDDPLGHAFRAQSTVIGLFPKLVERMDASREPLRPEDLRRLEEAAGFGAARLAERHAMQLARAANRRTIALLAGGAVAIAVSFGAGGFWLGRASVIVPTVSNCAPAPQASGGEAFACTFWTHPPTASQR